MTTISRSFISRTFRRTVLLGTPLALAFTDLSHPTDFTADVFGSLGPGIRLWLGLHLAHLLLFGFLTMSVYMLTDSLKGWPAALSRMAAGIFVVFYTSTDAVSGLAVGTLIRNARDLPATQQEVIAQAVQRLFFDPLVGGGLSLVGAVASLAWLVAVLAAAGALYRAGASVIAVFFLIVSGVLFGISHAPPFGPLGMLSYFLAALKIEWRRLRSGSAPPAPPPAATEGEKP